MSATGGGWGSVPFPVFLPRLLITEKTHEGEEGERGTGRGREEERERENENERGRNDRKGETREGEGSAPFSKTFLSSSLLFASSFLTTVEKEGMKEQKEGRHKWASFCAPVLLAFLSASMWQS